MKLIFLGIFVLSIAWAVRSMRDFIVPQSIKRLLTRVRMRGTILFFRGTTRHYKKDNQPISKSGKVDRKISKADSPIL